MNNIGVDICEIQKFKQYPIELYKQFYNKIFTKYEINYCLEFSSPESHFAGIFAAKEAIFKALNKFGSLSLSEITIIHDTNGAPKVEFYQNKKQSINNIYFGELKLDVKVSISHSKSHAIAFALATSCDYSLSTGEVFKKINEVSHIYEI